MLLLSAIHHLFSTTALLQLCLISTVVIVEAQPNANGWQVPHPTSEWAIEQDVNGQRSQLMLDDRNEEKHESTGSGFVSNALAAGVGTLLASGIANYAGYPYPTGVGYNNMGGAYVPGAYAGAYIPGASVYGPGPYVPGAGAYMPATYVPGASPYYPVAPGYAVVSTGYRPRDRDDSDAPDLADFGNSYPAYYSELLSGNTPPKTESGASTLPSDADAESSGVSQQDIRITSGRVRYPIDWSAVAHDYYRSINADWNGRSSSEAEREDVVTVDEDYYPL
ncbi:hypothetical protein GHT06_012275 [Daphnia sinensis]|uniref:Uncharacterized protein n=1 Tax=Daphnia sinensis TaxID=1820382 RepID=A0AAD5KVD9_9CRUS|nr:hypothetical protein GHT06_012275 [Daphnia sinensis]